MKHLALALLIAAGCAPALAGSCVALEYQEMKDMSASDLLVEACRANAASDLRFNESMLNRSYRPGREPFPNAQKGLEECNGQIDRMMRVLKTKGVDGKLNELCAQQAKGQGIHPSEASK